MISALTKAPSADAEMLGSQIMSMAIFTKAV